MNAFKLLVSEFTKLFAKKGVLIAVIGILLIPIIYAAILLSATWGPYDNLNKVPVAVVNNDAGGVSNGQPINIGNDLVEELKSANTLGWDFVSEEEALSGLDDNEYYMVIEIPEDFSQKAVTVLDKNPQIPELKYIQNEGLNYLASQVTNNAVNTLKASLGDKITATYARTLFTQLGAISDGFDTGADGSGQIHEGTVTLSGGTSKLLSNLKEKAPDIARLAEGAATADQGAGTLLSSVQGGTGSINQLNAGANTLASKVSDGTGSIDQLNAGANTLASKVSAGTSSIDKLKAGANTLATKVSDGTSSIDQLTGGASLLATKVSGGTSSIDQLNGGASLLATKVSDGTSSIDQLNGGAGQLASKVSDGTSSIDQLNGGAGQLASKVSGGTESINALNAGAGALNVGVQNLNDNLVTFKNGVESNTALVDGVKTLNDEVKASLNKINTDTALTNTIGALATDVITVSTVLNTIPVDGVITAGGGTLTALNSLEAKINQRLAAADVTAEEKQILNELNGIISGYKPATTGLGDIVATLSNEQTKASINGAKSIAASLHEGTTPKGNLAATIGGVNNFKTEVLTGLTKIDVATDGVPSEADGNGAKDLQLGAKLSKDTVAGTINQFILATNGEVDPGETADLLVGTSQLSEGTKTLKGSWTELEGGTKQLSDGTKQLKGSWTELEGGTKQLSDGTKQLKGSWTELEGGTKQLSDGTKQLKGSWTELEGGTKQLSDGTKTLKGSWTTLEDGTKQLSDGTKQLKGSWTTLEDGTKQLSGGTNQLKGSWTTLADGTQQLSAGTDTLVNSWAALTNGAASLKDGLGQISSGTATVNTGWGILTEGATQLDEGATKLKDGSKELATGLSNGSEEVKSKLSVSDDNITMFSSPVNVNGEKVNDYTYYRDSTAPYILSLALFVGMLILSLFVDFKKPAVLPGSPISWFLGKLLHLSILAVVQGLLLSVFALAVLGLDVENPVLFILFAMFVSLVFMSIIFFLVSVAGNVGRYIAIVFIVLQLSITGSNLPTIMLPDGLENLSKFLPLTYSNSGFKSAIALGDLSLLTSNAAVLLIYFVLGIALTLVTFILSYKALSKKFAEQVS